MPTRQELPTNPEINVEIPGDALIPREYIDDDAERYDFYQRMYTADGGEEIDALFSEMQDRFGEVPEETEQLRTAILLKIAAAPTGATVLRVEQGQMRLDLPSESNRAYYEEWFQPMMYAVNEIPEIELEVKGKSLSILFHDIDGLDRALSRLTRFVGAMKKGSMQEAPTPES